MKNTLIIISGMPATGKTRFAEWLSCEICVSLLSLDDVWEKAETSTIPFDKYWILCENIMKSSKPLIIEFGFDDKLKPAIDELIKKYKYHTINVHFDTLIETAHCRFNDRRHNEMGGSKPQISLEQFKKIIGFDETMSNSSKDFRFGGLIIYVDTTDFSTVSYMNIAKQIQQYATGGE